MSEKKDKLYQIIKKIGKIAFALVMLSTLIVGAGSLIWATKDSALKIEKDMEKRINSVEKSTDKRFDKIEKDIVKIGTELNYQTKMIEEIRKAVIK